MNGNRKDREYLLLKAFLRNTVGLYFRLRYRLKAENIKALKTVPGPWLILPNHVMTWDPVLISIHIKDPIYYIASDANFRKPFASRWMKRFGAIPTSKQATDFATLRKITETLKKDRHVGIFPEGERTWDGVSQDIIPATAKLVRLAGASVITPIFKGAYQCRPRWAYKSRRGPVTIEYRIAIRREELTKMSLSDIEDRIRQVTYHDDHAYQKNRKTVYRTATPAEPLEVILFTCPNCRSLNTLRSRRDRLTCRSCGWESRFTTQGCFEKIEPHRHYFDTIRPWNLWQIRELEVLIVSMKESGSGSPLFSDQPAVYSTGYKFDALMEQDSGSLEANINGISFTPVHGKASMFFPWTDITALNVVYQSQIEFYYQKTLHVFSFPEKHVSGYKYLCAGRILQKLSDH